MSSGFNQVKGKRQNLKSFVNSIVWK